MLSHGAAVVYGSVEIGALAGRALHGARCSTGNIPLVAAVIALELPFHHFNVAPMNCQGFAVDKKIGQFAMSRVDDVSEGLSRDIHFSGCLFLIETLEVRQSNGLDLVQGKDDFLDGLVLRICGCESIPFGTQADFSAEAWSWHRAILPHSLLAYANNKIALLRCQASCGEKIGFRSVEDDGGPGADGLVLVGELRLEEGHGGRA